GRRGRHRARRRDHRLRGDRDLAHHDRARARRVRRAGRRRTVSALVPLLATLPLLGAGIALIFGRHRRMQVAISIVTLSVVFVIATVLLFSVDAGSPIAVSVGGWPIP